MTSTPETPLRCAEHPNTETYLRCGRCDKPICPKCLVYTPVGTRCKDCARLKKLPVYNVTPGFYLRALAAGAGSALVLGVIWSFLPGGGFFLIWIMIFLGYLIGEAVSRAANRKRGPGLMAIAVFSVLLAFAVRLAVPLFVISFQRGASVIPIDSILARIGTALLDPITLLLVAVGAVLAALRLR